LLACLRACLLACLLNVHISFSSCGIRRTGFSHYARLGFGGKTLLLLCPVAASRLRRARPLNVNSLASRMGMHCRPPLAPKRAPKRCTANTGQAFHSLGNRSPLAALAGSCRCTLTPASRALPQAAFRAAEGVMRRPRSRTRCAVSACAKTFCAASSSSPLPAS
jgi:hypothetical protein